MGLARFSRSKITWAIGAIVAVVLIAALTIVWWPKSESYARTVTIDITSTDAAEVNPAAEIPNISAAALDIEGLEDTQLLVSELTEQRGGNIDTYDQAITINATDYNNGIVLTATGNNEQDVVDLANQAATIWVAQFNAAPTIPNDIEFHAQIKELAE